MAAQDMAVPAAGAKAARRQLVRRAKDGGLWSGLSVAVAIPAS